MSIVMTSLTSENLQEAQAHVDQVCIIIMMKNLIVVALLF